MVAGPVVLRSRDPIKTYIPPPTMLPMPTKIRSRVDKHRFSSVFIRSCSKTFVRNSFRVNLFIILFRRCYIKDDEIIGVKSTSIKFKNDPKKFLLFCYLVFFVSLIIVGINMNFKLFYFIFLIIPTTQLFIFQIKKLNISNTSDCLTKFKSNNLLGLIVLINIFVGKLI